LFEALIEDLDKNEREPSSSPFLNPQFVSQAHIRGWTGCYGGGQGVHTKLGMVEEW